MIQQSDFLDLNLLASNDYVGHWDVPINENFTTIDSEFSEIATELLTTPASPYDGKLSGTAASLEARLNVGIRPGGTLNFNTNDLDASRYGKSQRTTETIDVHKRLNTIDERDFVSDQLMSSIRTGSFLTPQQKTIKSRSNRLTGSSYPDQEKYSNYCGADFENFHFRGDTAANLMSIVATDLVIEPLGLMQIGGNLFNHTLRCWLPLALPNDYHLIIVATNMDLGAAPGFIDCQKIRSSVETTHVGSANFDSVTPAFYNRFLSTDIGSSLGDGNNLWVPQSGQILRIEDGGEYFDYVIKTVAAGYVDIYGRFDRGFSNCNWTIYDFSQPNIWIYPYGTGPGSSATPQDIMESYYTKYASYLQIGYADIVGATSLLFPTFSSMANTVGTRSILVPIPFNSDGTLVAGTSESVALEGISIPSIKALSILTIEKLVIGGPLTNYYFTINPKREVTVGLLDFYLPSCRAYIKITGNDFSGSGYICQPQAVNIVVEHPAYNDGEAGRSGWSMTFTASHSLQYVGVLVELL